MKELLDSLRNYKSSLNVVAHFLRKDCDSTAQELRGAGIKAEAYHAGLSDRDRVAVQEKWINSEACKVRDRKLG